MRHQLLKRLLFLFVLFPALLAAQNYTDNQALLEIIINGEDVGAYRVVLKDGDVIIPAVAFKNWRIKKALWDKTSKDVSLKALAPQLQYSIDNNNANLEITATADSFETQIIETQTQYNPVIPADVVHPAPWSGFLNYALNTNLSQAQGFDSLNAPWEVGVTRGQWFGFSQFNSNYSNFNHLATTLRGASYLQWEDTQTRQKVTFGDFSVNSPILSSGGRFGGILWQSNFRQYQQFQFMPTLDMNLNVQNPSHAELYVNNIKTREWDLQPGMVNLPSVLTSGQGNTTLVLTDAFGRQQQISQPFYITQQLLKADLHDFYYGLGLKRKASIKNFDYAELVALGSHRYGINNDLTAGAAFTISHQVSNLGVSFTHAFMGNSLIDAALTGSHQEHLHGYLAVARYQFNLQSLNLNLALNAAYMSQHYGNLDIDAASLQKSKYNLQASLNFSIPALSSSIGASFSQATLWSDSQKSQQFSVFYRQALFSTLSLNAQLSHNLTTGDNVASLMLSYFPQTQNESDLLHNNNLSYQASYDDKTHVDKQAWQTQKQGNIGEGYNYTAALQKQNQDLSGFARYQYKNNNGIYTASYAQNEQTISGNLGVSGSLVTANNEVYFARPVTDSFAVVKVQGTEDDVPIYQDGARFGVANENKAIVIPTLQSRRIGKISIKPQDMGLAVVADRTEQVIEVGVRTANTVEFALSQFVAVEGHAYSLAKNGSKEYLEALPLEYNAHGKLQESFIAKKGFFYLENVSTGKFNAMVKRYTKDCILHLTIPKTDKVIVNLGDVLCESN